MEPVAHSSSHSPYLIGSTSGNSEENSNTTDWEKLFQSRYPRKHEKIKDLQGNNWKILTNNERIIRYMRSHARSVSPITHNPQLMYIDRQYMVQVTIWPLISKICVRDLAKNHNLGNTNCLGMPPITTMHINKENLFVGFNDGSICMLRLSDMEEIKTLKTKVKPNHLDSHGNLLYVHGENNILQIWDSTAEQMLSQQQNVTQFLGANNLTILYQDEAKVMQKYLSTNEVYFQFPASEHFCYNQNYFIQCHEEDSKAIITIWNLKTGQQIHAVELPGKITLLHCDETSLVIGFEDGTLQFVNIEHAGLIYEFKEPEYFIDSVKWNENFVVIGGKKGIRILDLNTDNINIRKVDIQSQEDCEICYVDDIKIISQHDHNETLTVRDIETGKQLVVLASKNHRLRLAYADETTVIARAIPLDINLNNSSYLEYDFTPKKKEK